MLKFTKFLTVFALLLTFSACNNDDDVVTLSSDGLEGNWTAVFFEADVTGSTEFNGETTVSATTIEASSLSYDLTFTDAAFTTSGGYTMGVSSSVDGNVVSTSSDDYTDVSGSGTYTATDTELTLNGSFFEFEFNGQPFNQANGAQTANYEINADGELVISQNETISTTANGVTSTTTIVSTSRWMRQ